MNWEFALYHLVFIGIAALLAQSLTFVWRAKLFSLGHHAFFAIGAYTAVFINAVFLPREPGWFLEGGGHRLLGCAALFGSILAGTAVAGLAAAMFGRILVRLQGDYFAVATLILGEAVYRTFGNIDLLGAGLGSRSPYLFFSNSTGESLLFVGTFVLIVLALNAAAYVFLRRIETSVFGLWMNAARDDDTSAQCVGLDTRLMQTIAFTIGGAIAGAAGTVLFYYVGGVVPGDFSFLTGVTYIIYVILGGVRLAGSIVAAMLIYTIIEAIKLRLFGVFGDAVGQFVSDWRNAALGGVLVLAVIVAHRLGHLPQGGHR